MIFSFKLWQTSLFAISCLFLGGCSQSMAPFSSESNVTPRTDSLAMISGEKKSPFMKRRRPIETDAVRALPVPGQPNELSLPDGEMFAAPPGPSEESDSQEDVENVMAKGRPSPAASHCPPETLDKPDFLNNTNAENLPSSNENIQDDAPQEQAPDFGTVTKCYRPNTWFGNTPPDCDNNGAFRRDYSPPGYTSAGAVIQVPGSNPKLSRGPCPTHGDTGYIYLESWPGSQAVNSEGGFLYSEARNEYNLYIRDQGLTYVDEMYPFPAGSIINLQLSASDTRGNGGLEVSAGLDATDNSVDCPNGSPDGIKCGFALYSKNPLYIADCCIFGRMTTIAQDQALGSIFNDGAVFGPVQWEDAALIKFYFPSFSYFVQSDWTGSSQDWPNDPTRIQVSGYSPTGETDIINLHR